MQSTETWRTIPGYLPVYEVSDHGRVRSRDHKRNAKNGSQATQKGRVLSPSTNRKTGYPFVSIRDDAGVQKTRNVHSLVAAAFLGPCPDGMEILHRDGQPGNPDLANLHYGTAAENAADQVRHGVHWNASKTHCPQGHPYDSANTYVRPNGHRRCRACQAIWQANRKPRSRR